MSNIERLEALFKVPDFETKANLLVTRISTLASLYPNMEISPENATLKRMESGPLSARWFEEKKWFDLAVAEREKNKENDIESSYKNTVYIPFGSTDLESITSFIKKAEKIAEDLGGEKIPGNPFVDLGEKTRGFRFQGKLYYDFK